MVANDEISATFAIESMQKHGSDAVEKLSETVAAAKAAGKKSATAKDDPAARLLARQKAAGPELFKLIDKLMKNPKCKAAFAGADGDALDSLMFRIENEPAKKVKEPKPAKVKVEKKLPAAKKAAAKKTPAKKKA